MFWLFGFGFRLAWRLKIIVIPALAGLATGLYLQLREEQRTWGVVPAEGGLTLPGDGLIGAPDVSETRSLKIDAPPAAVWPWLVQMGWGRGGWYSYDRFDLEGQSTQSILDEYQGLVEGDQVPTDPGGGFVAKVVEPDEALVLYLDSELVKSRLGDTAADPEGTEPVDDDEGLPAGLQMSGTMGDFAMPEFRATWAFVLEPEPDGGTRLIERMRLWGGDGGTRQRLALPLMGMGVFVMTRKHMLGVKERAERLADEGGTPEPVPASEGF
jgi:hypothetical protein